MTQKHQSHGAFGRLWQFVLATSERAVAIHYAAPWSLARQDTCNGGATGR